MITHLMFMEKGKPIALISCCGMDKAGRSKRSLFSHRGSSYGGIVQPINQGVEKNVKIVKVFNVNMPKQEWF